MNNPDQLRIEANPDTNEPSLRWETATQQKERCDQLEITCERSDLAARAIASLYRALDRLGVHEWHLPKVNVVFQPAETMHGLAQVDVKSTGIDVVFDDRFRTAENEHAYLRELHEAGISFPGVEQTLVHELGHVALWSITGMDRQPATRLVDEGWASLLEHAGKEKNTDMSLLTQETKEDVRRGLAVEHVAYERCFDLRRVVTHEEGLNAAEYAVGRALLLWIREVYGQEALLDFMRRSISCSRRNADRERDGGFEEAVVDWSVHGREAAASYAKLIASSPELQPEELQRKALQWEGGQLERALMRATGLQSAEEVKTAFRKWIEQ